MAKNILFITAPFDGHIAGLLEVIKDLISLGHNVTIYLLDKYEPRLKQSGVKLKLFSYGKINLPPQAPQIALNNFILCQSYDAILSQAIKSEEKYDYLIVDSLLDSYELNKIFKIPILISYHTFQYAEFPPNLKETANYRMKALIPINKKYNINIKDFMSIDNDKAKYKLILTSKLFHVENKLIDDSFYFIGPSIEERPIDTTFNFKKDENKKLIYISLGTVFSLNKDIFKMFIETFKNLKEFQVIMSIGNIINPKDLGELPDNIYIYNYVPQLQILKETDIFITHGGLNSINEGILIKQLPFIIIPQEVDQFVNAKQLEKNEAGIILDKKNLTNEILKDSVYKIIQNEQKYKKGVERIAQSFKEAREERKKIYEKIFI